MRRPARWRSSTATRSSTTIVSPRWTTTTSAAVRPRATGRSTRAPRILVGDALQALAFEVLAEGSGVPPPSPARRLEMIGVLAAACGADGMVGGQAVDLAAAGRTLSRPAMEDNALPEDRGAHPRGGPAGGARGAAASGSAGRAPSTATPAAWGSRSRSGTTSSIGTRKRVPSGRPAGSDDAKRKPTCAVRGGRRGSGQAGAAMECVTTPVATLAGLGREADPLRDLGPIRRRPGGPEPRPGFALPSRPFAPDGEGAARIAPARFGSASARERSGLTGIRPAGGLGLHPGR